MIASKGALVAAGRWGLEEEMHEGENWSGTHRYTEMGQSAAWGGRETSLKRCLCGDCMGQQGPEEEEPAVMDLSRPGKIQIYRQQQAARDSLGLAVTDAHLSAYTLRAGAVPRACGDEWGCGRQLLIPLMQIRKPPPGLAETTLDMGPGSERVTPSPGHLHRHLEPPF